MRNPFNPTFGDVPQLFIDDGESEKLVELIRNSDFARSFFVTGVRGAGKTSFMSKVMKKFAEDKNCYAINLINKEDMVDTLCSKLANAIHRIHGTIDSVSVSGVSVKTLLTEMSNEERLESLLRKVKKQGKYVVIAVDEVTNTPTIRSFAQYFSLLKQQDYPIFVIMTGLPDLILNIQNDDKLTFLLRSEKIYLGELSSAQILEEYCRVFHGEMVVMSKMTQAVEGYSYAFQLLGYLLFERCQGKIPSNDDLNAVMDDFKNRLFENAYQKIFLGLSDMDCEFLLAMQKNAEFGEIVNQMQKSKVYVAQYRKRLIDRCLISPQIRGRLKFNLPFFDEYLKAVQNPDSIFYLGI